MERRAGASPPVLTGVGGAPLAGRTVALLGGAFDPPHVAHALAAYYVLATAPVDALWLVPTYRHPFGKRMAPYEARAAMCEALASTLGPRARVCRSEALLGGPSYTVTLLEHLRDAYPDTRWRLVVGADVLRDRSAWRDFERVERLAPLLVLGRAGFRAPAVAPVELPRVASSDVRRRLRAGEDVRALVPAAVLAEVERRGLYRA